MQQEGEVEVTPVADRVMARDQIYRPRDIYTERDLPWAKLGERPTELKQAKICVEYYRIRGVMPTGMARRWGDYEELEKAMGAALDEIRSGKALQVELFAIDGDYEYLIAICHKTRKFTLRGWDAYIGWTRCI